MIIDEILDARDGNYDASYFYLYVTSDERAMNLKNGTSYFPISRALDGGNNEDVQRELCAYIDKGNYNPSIKKFINSFTWVTD